MSNIEATLFVAKSAETVSERRGVQALTSGQLRSSRQSQPQHVGAILVLRFILLLDELTALGVAFVSLGEGIDTSTPAGRLLLHVLGAIAERERDRIRERVEAGASPRAR